MPDKITGKRGRTIDDKLTPLGRIVRRSRAARWYHDGDGAGFVWRWWHPITWIAAPSLLLASGLIYGFPEAWRSRHEVGLGMKPWFLQNPDRLTWG